MIDTTEIDNDYDDGGSIEVDRAELACMSGHQEARDELIQLGWSSEQVDDLEGAARGYEDFARCVVDELRWEREHGGE
jgi:hypothetical protein